MTLEDNINRLILRDDSDTIMDYTQSGAEKPFTLWLSDNGASYLAEAGFNLVALYERAVQLSLPEIYNVPLGIKELGYQFMISETARGVAFPPSPLEGQIFYRDDLDTEYVYRAPRWLSTQVFHLEMKPQKDVTAAFNSTQYNTFRAYFPCASSIYIEAVRFYHYSTTLLTNVDNYLQTIKATAYDGSSTVLSSSSNWAAGRVINQQYRSSPAIPAASLSDFTVAFFQQDYTKNGTNPSGFGAQPAVIRYRKIG
jgi:hypothetical protein